MTTPPPPYDTREDLIAFVRKSLEGYLSWRGKVFYSGFDTYQKAQVIFLGYNPGGGGDDSLENRICVEHLHESNWNDYYNDPWDRDHDGKKLNRLQKRVVALFPELGLNIHEVFTTNLYFKNTVKAQELDHKIDRDKYMPFKKACWAVIDHFLSVVPASVILCNGNNTFWRLLDCLKKDATNVECSAILGKRGKVLFTTCIIHGRSRLIIGIPHLSWVDVGRCDKVVDELKRRIDKACTLTATI